ncbi:hypothetical protein Dsin_000645 [Dipteronia sinensis]|uniref:Reverse transcriptase domain-containing protein n=1 Tax=Dipteronia sinensis TaxID=43782 RepID=A0AAE0B3U6_9ROSI|nr:hypothetical protein Dsin_000645 [Dipteronia sinensis]
MGFGGKWRRWMECCISTLMLSVLVNGSLTRQFKLEKDLRQGDSLSLLLFNVAVEGLSALFKKAESLDLIKGVTFGAEAVHVSHLQFADDTILFLQPNMNYLMNAKRILRIAKRIEGLQRKFFWGDVCDKRKIHTVNWETMCRARNNGGLGIGLVIDKNKGLLAKWIWRFGREEDLL